MHFFSFNIALKIGAFHSFIFQPWAPNSPVLSDLLKSLLVLFLVGEPPCFRGQQELGGLSVAVVAGCDVQASGQIELSPFNPCSVEALVANQG